MKAGAKTGIVIFAHGSSVASANEAVRAVAAQAAAEGEFTLYETAFLDVAPRLGEAAGMLIERGASAILIVPYFLTLGLHLQRDLPAMVREIEEAHPGVPVRVTPPLDGHPALSAIVAERARAGLGS